MHVVIIDMQERLVPALRDCDQMVRKAQILAQAAQLLDQDLSFTEQNPDKLGRTVDALQLQRMTVVPKMSFDASAHVPKGEAPVVVAGCEAHICVKQTVDGLLEQGRRVIVATDAIGSRNQPDYDAALRAMDRAGAELQTVEMIVFGWMKTAEHPRFREISRLIK